MLKFFCKIHIKEQNTLQDSKHPPSFYSRYKELFEEGKTDKALKSCQDYLGKMEELKLPFPHRNYELAAIALCSCLWRVATKNNT